MAIANVFFHPASIAVVGTSSDPRKLSGRPVGYLRKHGYKGQIFPINPRYDVIGDLKCFAHPRELPEAPDLGLVLVGTDRVIDAVRQLAGAGTKAAIVLAGGFGEMGEEGMARQIALRQAAGTMRLLGPNTVGLVNLTDRIMLSASGAMEMTEFTSGCVALISQSGGILGSLLSRASQRGIGLSKLVATGNEVDMDVADFVDALAGDEATGVIALYLETIRDAVKFRRAAGRALASGKKLVAYKVGRSESGARAAVSHTGALAGAAEVYDAFFDQLGIIQAKTFSDLLDIPSALASGRFMVGKNAAIVTSTGGVATMVADNIGLAGLDVPDPDPKTAADLQSLDLRDAILDRNPIDVTLAGLNPDLFRKVLRILVDSKSYDAVIAIFGASAITRPEIMAVPLEETLAVTDKPLLAYVSPAVPKVIEHLNKVGIPAFAMPESCASALLAMQPRAVPAIAPPRPAPVVDCGSLPVGSLNEVEAMALFSRFGIPVPRGETAASPQDAAMIATTFDGPVVIKILSDDVHHKSDIGGVAVSVDAQGAEACCTEMLTRIAKTTSVKVRGFIVQELVRGGVEMILGFGRDPRLGSYVLLGAGGISAELYRDTALALLPLDRERVRQMIDGLSCSALLKGFRGRPPADVEALTDAILAFADMVAALGGRLTEAEINPIFVLPQGQGVRASDGLVVMG